MPQAITQRPQQEVAELRRGHQHVILYAHLSIRKVRHIFGSNGEEAEGQARGASDSTGNQQIAKAAISLQDTQPDARAGFTSGAARSLRRLRRRDAWDAARLASERKTDKRDEHHSKSDRKAERKVGREADGRRGENQRRQGRAADAQQATQTSRKSEEAPAPVLWDGPRHQIKPGRR